RRQAHVHPATLAQGDVDTGEGREVGGEARPFARRLLRPYAVGGHAEALALHPDETEVAARCAISHVTFVDNCEARAEVAQSERDCGADEAAADNRDIEIVLAHVATPAKRRIAGICATKSVNVWSPPPRTY